MKKGKRIVVYPGTFDPLTDGHLWTISRAAEIFDEVVVAIGVNPDKKTIFSVEDRIEMLETVIKKHKLVNVSVSSYCGEYLAKYVSSIGSKHIVRGSRNHLDFTYEQTINNVNGRINSNIVTVLLIPPTRSC